jgi:type II secretory pathway component GspD/PulD (secretin)
MLLVGSLLLSYFSIESLAIPQYNCVSSIIINSRSMNMLKLTSFVLLALTCGVAIAWGQTSTSPVLSGVGQKNESDAPQSTTSTPSRPAVSTSAKPTIEAVTVIPSKNGSDGYVRVVHRLKNAPAASIATTLQNLFKAESIKTDQLPESEKPISNKVVITFETISNCLLLSGPTAAVDEVRQLASQLDHSPVMIRLVVSITEPLEQSEKGASEKTAGDKLILSAEITTVDNQPASIQLGRSEPHIVGVNTSSVGKSNQISNTNVGTNIKMTPRAGSDGMVAMQLDVKDSRFGPLEEGVVVANVKGEEVRTPNIETFETLTTLKLKDGQPSVISSSTNYGKTRKTTVTAYIVHTENK